MQSACARLPRVLRPLLPDVFADEIEAMALRFVRRPCFWIHGQGGHAFCRARKDFLHNLGLTDVEASVNYNFAPPALRWAIGILVFLHQRVLGLRHPGVRDLLPFRDLFCFLAKN